MPKINQSIETEVFDSSGNMVSKRANKTLSWGAEPSFVKVYLQDVVFLSDLPSKHSSILYELLKRATYAGEKDGMQVIVNTYLKQKIQETIGFKNLSSVNNAITDLVKGKILYRVGTGAYNFNAYLFGKGDWQDIARLRLEIDYNDIQGKTFKAVCEYKEDEKQTNKSNYQRTILENEEHAAAIEPEKKKECCHQCGAEKVEMPKKDGTSFMGCPNWQEHKRQKGA